FGDVDLRGAIESSRLRDLHFLAVHRRLHVALDDEQIAVGDLDALQLDVDPDEELAAGGGRSCGCNWGSGCGLRDAWCRVPLHWRSGTGLRRAGSRVAQHGRVGWQHTRLPAREMRVVGRGTEDRLAGVSNLLRIRRAVAAAPVEVDHAAS